MHCSVVPTHCLAICAALILTVVLLAMVGPATGQPSTPDTKDGQTYGQIIRRVRSLRSKYYCGHQIVQILSLLCDGNYHGPSKRNGQSADDTKQNQLNNGIAPFWDDMAPKGEYSKPDDSSDELFLEPEKAFNMFGGSSDEATGAEGFTRNRRGIVDECCKKACTIWELSSYCQKSPL